MDFRATLEYQMKYRKHFTDGEKIATNLKECAIIISDTNSRMLEIRKQIERSRQIPVNRPKKIFCLRK